MFKIIWMPFINSNLPIIFSSLAGILDRFYYEKKINNLFVGAIMFAQFGENNCAHHQRGEGRELAVQIIFRCGGRSYLDGWNERMIIARVAHWWGRMDWHWRAMKAKMNCRWRGFLTFPLAINSL
jgi:hypothetical protein